MSIKVNISMPNVLNMNHYGKKDLFVILILFTTFIIFACLFFYGYQDQSIWAGMKLATGNAFQFCEQNKMNSNLVQTSNTWSNLGYLIVGLFMLFLGIKDTKYRKIEKNNLLLQRPVFSIILGISIIYLFIGSFFYHASLTYFFQMLDQTGMYAILLCFMAYNAYRIWPEYTTRKQGKRSSLHLILLILFILDFLFLIVLWKLIDINILFTTLVLSFIAFSIIYTLKTKPSRISKSFLFSAVIIYFFSMTLWILDRKNIFCDPESFLQGHALWHLFTALAILLLYFSYRSEKSLLRLS